MVASGHGMGQGDGLLPPGGGIPAQAEGVGMARPGGVTDGNGLLPRGAEVAMGAQCLRMAGAGGVAEWDALLPGAGEAAMGGQHGLLPHPRRAGHGNGLVLAGGQVQGCRAHGLLRHAQQGAIRQTALAGQPGDGSGGIGQGQVLIPLPGHGETREFRRWQAGGQGDGDGAIQGMQREARQIGRGQNGRQGAQHLGAGNIPRGHQDEPG